MTDCRHHRRPAPSGSGSGSGAAALRPLGSGSEFAHSALAAPATPPLRARARARARITGLLAFALMVALPVSPARAQDSDHPGKPVYDQWCAGCHGVDGTGNGPAAAYMLPRPRDFTQALYQIRTTESGALPTDADIRRIIDEGMPGTAMPGWSDKLSAADRDALVDYLKTFSPFFENLPPSDPLEAGSPPSPTEEAIAEGRDFYQQVECFKCHGQAGRGDGPSAPTQTDDNDLPIRPADLTENWYFNGGGSVEEIYMRLRSGLDGTPMPSFSDLIASGFMTDEQLWNLAHYVRSLSPEERPEVRDVVRAAPVAEGSGLPTTTEDSLWSTVEPQYIPLVGQIIEQPRWFAPTVDGVWVEALHDGEELVLRLSWNDPSQSPDSVWLEWQQRVLDTMEPVEGGSIEAAPRPDAFAVQFPQTVPEGRERPYFLMGDSRDPVYLWYWRSARPGSDDTADGGYAVEAEARGLNTIEPLPDGDALLTSRATWDAGRWRLLLRRPITTVDTTDADADPGARIQFETGRAIPMAFFAWDGSNAEEGKRGSISAWYFVYLDVPTPASVYTSPVLAMMLTAGLGLVVVVRAQRREKRDHDHDPKGTHP